jgi:hypothetical protein
MPNSATVLSRISRDLIELPTRVGDPEGEAILRKSLTDLENTFSPIVKKEELIRRDTRLTIEGKREKLVELSKQSAHALDFLEDLLKQTKSAHAVLTTRVYPPTPVLTGNEAVLRHLQYSEIRSLYRDKDANERSVAYLHALETGNTAVAEALVSAPEGQWIAADILERGQTEAAKQRDRGTFERMTAKGVIVETLDSLLSHSRSALASLAANDSRYA